MYNIHTDETQMHYSKEQRICYIHISIITHKQIQIIRSNNQTVAFGSTQMYRCWKSTINTCITL